MDEVVTKYMTFHLISQTQKTQKWAIFNNQSDYLLGEIAWYGPWRQYCFYPEAGSVFNNGCLTTILGFIARLKANRV